MPQPPKLARWLFDWYCCRAKVEDLRGDLDEHFHRNVGKHGATKAAIRYWKQVLSLIFSYAVKKRLDDASYATFSTSGFFPMLASYLKVSWRNLAKHRYFTVINVAGLAIGMSISLLFLTLFISVTNYDEFHVNKDKIFRIISSDNHGNELASAPAVLAEKLMELPDVAKVVRMRRGLWTEEPRPKQNVYLRGYFADRGFFDVFTFPLIKGTPATALERPRTIVLTASAVKNVFGDEDPIGKTITMALYGDFEITGVMADYPANSHMSFNAIASYASTELGLANTDSWQNFRDSYVYFLVNESANLTSIAEYLDQMSNDHYSMDDQLQATFEIQSLRDITPGPELDNQVGPQWSYLSFMISGAIAMLILLPACFNYANISIARALKRSREIGLRKTLGGVKSQIFLQFITETVLLTVLSLLGAILIFAVIRGEFQSMLVHAASLDLSLTWDRFLWFLLFALVTGFLAGLFPALYFARLNPIEAIRSNTSVRALSGLRLRKGLIVFQFGLCLAFVLSMLIIGKQYRYATNFDLGFKKENILDVELQGVDPQRFASEFSTHSFVHNLSFSSSVMGHGVPDTFVKHAEKPDSASVYYMHVDGAFLRNMDLTLLAGRTFREDEKAESAVIINEVLFKRLGFAGPSEALGEVVTVDGKPAQVCGVVKDFHFHQLHAPVSNFLFRYNPEKFRLGNVKVSSDDIDDSFRRMDRSWKAISDTNFTAKFLEDETADAFSNYNTLLKIFGFLGLLAVSVSCLGLLGMVVYSAETRTKEVGIRKVMGASTFTIAVLLSRDYLKLMLIASIFSLPITFAIDFFLSRLEYYRVAITPLDILLGITVMILIGLGTMATQTMRAASANPADTLKYE